MVYAGKSLNSKMMGVDARTYTPATLESKKLSSSFLIANTTFDFIEFIKIGFHYIALRRLESHFFEMIVSILDRMFWRALGLNSILFELKISKITPIFVLIKTKCLQYYSKLESTLYRLQLFQP